MLAKVSGGYFNLKVAVRRQKWWRQLVGLVFNGGIGCGPRPPQHWQSSTMHRSTRFGTRLLCMLANVFGRLLKWRRHAVATTVAQMHSVHHQQQAWHCLSAGPL
jgi:hypothetical protein